MQTRSHAADGLGIGSAIGGTVGAVLAAIAAVGTSIVIPGLGLFVAGPIAAALMKNAPQLLAEPPKIEQVDVLAAKVTS